MHEELSGKAGKATEYPEVWNSHDGAFVNSLPHIPGTVVSQSCLDADRHSHRNGHWLSLLRRDQARNVLAVLPACMLRGISGNSFVSHGGALDHRRTCCTPAFACHKCTTETPVDSRGT